MNARTRTRGRTTLTAIATAIVMTAVFAGPAWAPPQGSAPMHLVDQLDPARTARIDESGALRVAGAVSVDGEIAIDEPISVEGTVGVAGPVAVQGTTGSFPASGPTAVQGGASTLSISISGIFAGDNYVNPFPDPLSADEQLHLTSTTFANRSNQEVHLALFVAKPCPEDPTTSLTRRFGFDVVVGAFETLHLSFPQPPVITESESTWCPVWIQERGTTRLVSTLAMGYVTQG